MQNIHFLFFAILFLFSISVVYAEDVIITVDLQPSGQITDHNNIINSTLSVSDAFDIVPMTKTIGVTTVTITQFAQFIADPPNQSITLQNTDLSTVTVLIPDQTALFATAQWDGDIIPPTIVSTSAPSGYQTTFSYKVGSSDSVLVFDKPVTMILEGVTEKIAYKLPQYNWVIMKLCDKYDNPTPPSESNECYINNGIDTKIITFHFTEFAGIKEEPNVPDTPSNPIKPTKPSSSGGHGRTGVGPTGYVPPVYGGWTSSPTVTPTVTESFPSWFQYNLVKWWTEELVSDEEFKNAMTYLIDKRILIITDYTHPKVQHGELQPSAKSIFEMWSNDKLSDSMIHKTIQQYRLLGVW